MRTTLLFAAVYFLDIRNTQLELPMELQTHYCIREGSFPLDRFHQKGLGKGINVLLVGESPAPNGWRLSGKACYDDKGNL